MKRVEVASYPVRIWIAGSAEKAADLCCDHCDEVGLCVSITPTLYGYTGGREHGVIVGLINYPRFPSAPEAIWQRAEVLAARLRVGLGQQSYTIEGPDRTVWFNHRKEIEGC